MIEFLMLLNYVPHGKIRKRSALVQFVGLWRQATCLNLNTMVHDATLRR